MKCICCNKYLSGRQTKFCSRKCKDNNSGNIQKLETYQRIMSYNRKIYLINLLGGSCKNCGYNKCIRSLSFHHRDRANKKFNLSQMSLQSKSWEDILSEASKCDLLCLNCHTELHSNEDKTYVFDKLTKTCQKCNMDFLPLETKSYYCNKCKKPFRNRKK